MKSFSPDIVPKPMADLLAAKNITVPTDIQSKAIPLLTTHKGDFVGQSATGTGKTFAYGIPLLKRINPEIGNTQAVVLVPTRELCEQVGNELISLASSMPDVKVEAVYGGVGLKSQIHAMSNGVHVVVATPGRLMDLVERKVVQLSELDIMVIDEADEMLLKGFSTDIDKILDQSGQAFFTWLFSATMPENIDAIVNKYLQKNLKRIRIGEENRTNKEIAHQYIEVTPEEKSNVLFYHLHQMGDQRLIIFCRTKSGVQKLYKQLSTAKFSCGAVHGDLPQGLRNKVMEQFRNGYITILIATDVAARGVDVPAVSHVIQYHVPDTKDAYIHRSGRASRTGNTGINITFLFQEEKKPFLEMVNELSVGVEELNIPTPKDQLINKAILWAGRVAKEKPVNPELLEASSRKAFKEELDHLSKEELLEKLLATYLRELQG